MLQYKHTIFMTGCMICLITNDKVRDMKCMNVFSSIQFNKFAVMAGELSADCKKVMKHAKGN